MDNLVKKLIARNTWERVEYFASSRSLREKPQPLEKEDVLPLILMIFLTGLACVVSGFIIWILSKYISVPFAFVLTVAVMTTGMFLLKRFFKQMIGYKTEDNQNVKNK